MIHIHLEANILIAVADDLGLTAQSPEQLLIALEDAMERGDLSPEDVATFLRDFTSRARDCKPTRRRKEELPNALAVAKLPPP